MRWLTSIPNRVLIAVIGFAVACVVLSRVLTVVGEVGHKDVLITFSVKDADTDQPVPNASIHVVRAEGGLCSERDENDFVLACDGSGCVSELVKNCMWSSTRGFFVNAFYMHLPY